MGENEQSNRKYSKLAKSATLFLQILTALMIPITGLLLNSRIENTRMELRRLEDVRSFLPAVLSDDVRQSFLALKTLDRVLGRTDTLNRTIRDVIFDYYVHLLDSYVDQNKMDRAVEIARIADMVFSDSSFFERLSARKKKQVRKYESALRYERLGFQYLFAQKYDSAVTAFQTADSVYPGFHEVHEIAQLLKNYRRRLPEKRQEVYRIILSEMSWKLPEDIMDRLRQLSGSKY